MAPTTISYAPLVEALSALRRAEPFLIGVPNRRPLLRRLRTLLRFAESEETSVVVFGNTNRGKSTFLNALLGLNLAPVDLTPTTGAAIKFVYGREVTTTIRFGDGTERSEPGASLAAEFAVLSADRELAGVREVAITVPNPLLERHVCLVDLPGIQTDARHEMFVSNEILKADLVP